MKTMRLSVVKLIVLISFTSVSAQDQRARLDAQRAEGYEALYNLDYDGARKHFLKMNELAPDHPAGAQCLASSLWLQQLNEAWELKATLYSSEPNEKAKPQLNRVHVEEFRKWIRMSKQLSQARLKKDPSDVEALYFLGAAEGLEAAFAGGVERKYRTALRSGSDSVDRHKEVLKLSPEFRDAETHDRFTQLRCRLASSAGQNARGDDGRAGFEKEGPGSARTGFQRRPVGA